MDKILADCKNNLTFEEVLEYLSVTSQEIHDNIKDRKDEFITWFSNKSKFSFRIKRDWLAEPENDNCTEKIPDAATENKRVVTSYSNATSISSEGKITNIKAQQLHWFKFMNIMLLEMAKLLGEDYIPIIGDLIGHITGKGDQVLPRFSFIVHPKEKCMYERVEEVLKSVVHQLSLKHIHMSSGLKGSAKLRSLDDGRYQFSMSIDPPH